MLNFITIKKDPRFEYRFYLEGEENVDGKIIYRGHKLGVDESLLLNLLDYKVERTTNKIYLKDYQFEDQWFAGNNSNSIRVIQKSYESLQNKAEQQFGKFRKIVITRV